MKKRAIILSLLLLTAIMLAACEPSAYKEYVKAYDRLQKESSFATSIHEFSHSFDPATGEPDGIDATTDCQVVRTEAGYDGIVDILFYGKDDSYSVQVYIRDSRNYNEVHEDYMDEGETVGSSSACDADAAFKMATDGLRDLLELPKSVIVQQTVKELKTGKLLEFFLDTEKFCDWKFGETDDGNPYVSLGEPPSYTVWLDEEGRLKKVLFCYCLTNAEDDPSIMQYERQVDFLSYGDIELDFPELNEEDYPDMSDPAAQGNGG